MCVSALSLVYFTAFASRFVRTWCSSERSPLDVRQLLERPLDLVILDLGLHLGDDVLDQRARDIAAGKHFVGPKQLRPDAMYLALRLSAIRQDIRQRAGRVTGPIPIPHSKGFDFDSGFGFVDAATALRLTGGF